MADKYCFMNSERVCDLTCKAAFEVDDPIENIDCYFIWLAYHFGEGFYEIKRSLDGSGGLGSGNFGPGSAGPGMSPGPGGGGPKKPKGFPNN
jgi:hypothetical protein